MIIAELSEDGKAVEVKFQYSPRYVELIKRLPRDSRRFVPEPSKGGPLWRVRKDLVIMRRLREQFGTDLEIGERLRTWGHEEVSRERNLKDLSMADDAELSNIPKKLSRGVKFSDGRKFKLRPYQRADIAFMAEGRSINANQPGSGKTAEWVLSVIEAQLEWGFNFVCAPVSSLEDPWEDEIKELYRLCGLDEPTILTGNTPAQRKAAVREAKQLADEGMAFWLVINPYALRRKRQLSEEGKQKLKEKRSPTKEDYEDVYIFDDAISEVAWDSLVIDEFHLCGLTNTDTQFADGANAMTLLSQPSLLGCMSGTPMGGKPIKLWGALHFLAPDKFPSKWAWARQWLVINEGRFGSSIEGIQPGREQEFYEHLKPWLIRRTKPEVLPGLPPKTPIPVWCKMTPKQQEQYNTFERDAELRLSDAEEEGRLSATNVLAEYARLKQFASAFCEIAKSGILDDNDMPRIKVTQTEESGKFEMLLEKLAEENVLAKGKEDDKPKCAIIFSQFNGVIDAVTGLLEKAKVPCAQITGRTKQKERTELKKAFQAQSPGAPRVLVINTKAGGTALTLSRADSVHILDETWVPDDQEQAEDRAHRGDELTESKSHLNIYYYRTRESIEEHIQQLVADKDLNNKTILELRKFMESRYDAREAVAA